MKVKFSLSHTVPFVFFFASRFSCVIYVQHEQDIGSWKDVTYECKRGRLQPQVLFFEAHKCWLEDLDSLLIELCFLSFGPMMWGMSTR